MEAAQNSPVQRIFPVLLFFVGLIGLYYLYLYLFGPTTGNKYVLIDKTQEATEPVDTDKVILPKIYEGGEFSFSTWIYINNWTTGNNRTKSIIRMGNGEYDTIRIYLGKVKPSLQVRLTSEIPSTLPEDDTCKYYKGNNEIKEPFSDITGCTTCDIPEVDLQKWVNITVAVSSRIVDVYIDGKLSRSCVLDNMYKISDKYSVKILNNGGFGGKISTTVMYDTALNPEQVYKNYMSGPEPITSLKQWLLSFFAPGVDIAITTK